MADRLDADSRVSDDDVRRLLSRAAELDAAGPAVPRFCELEEIAREAGISSDALQQAWLELRRARHALHDRGVPSAYPKSLLARVGFVLLAAAAVLLSPAATRAQSWELEARLVSTDYRGRSSFNLRTNEPVPSGWGVAARHVANSYVFIELEYSRGLENRLGAICGGFIQDPVAECIPEDVRYFGSVLGLSVGWPGRVTLGSRWSGAIRPKIGLGAIHASEHGNDTGREHVETRLAVSGGIAAAISHFVPELGLGFSASVEAGRVRPVRISDCIDCFEVLRADLSRTVFGIALVWQPRRRQ